ncbi:ABC transporter ATP-binding protein [Paeniglutamicibacter antarcticus]|uniref:ATP-binding cassette domain-containing protein n=2 Tax=Paeniglutamicibacter antarcticus TaxID=494023 RepID=A0ABP9TJI4_9MICC
MPAVVTTTGLTKKYKNQTVVDSLDLHIPEACVYGFLGPNGSGKSTTMKLLLSLVEPTSGEVEIFGRRMDRSSRRHMLEGIGALIESPAAYGHLTGRENMRIVQHMLDLRPAQIDRAVASVRMEGQMGKKVQNYSLGMKQRLGIAMALARDPKLLVLDEPTNGLDPAGIEEIRDLMIRLAAEEGITVMVSSHLLAEIERMATVLGILQQGRLIFQGSKEDLVDRSLPDLLVDTADPDIVAHTFTRSLPSVGTNRVRIPEVPVAQTPEVVRELVTAGARIEGVRREEQSLETVFIKLTGREGLL